MIDGNGQKKEKKPLQAFCHPALSHTVLIDCNVGPLSLGEHRPARMMGLGHSLQTGLFENTQLTRSTTSSSIRTAPLKIIWLIDHKFRSRNHVLV